MDRTSRTGPLAFEARPTDVVCLGHALVDRLAEGTSEEVESVGLEPGIMTLVDAARAGEIEALRRDWEVVAGGSAADTAAGVASLGGNVTFVGSVGADDVGEQYRADLEASGVNCVLHRVSDETPTGVCHVLVGPRGQRTMATFLGAASALSVAAVEEARVEQASIVYIEGYLLDARAAAALERGIAVAHRSGTVVALTLSDPFVVERHRRRICALIESGAVDLLFGNEDEAMSVSSSTSLEGAVDYLSRPGMLSVITRGARGSLACFEGGVVTVEAEEVENVVDTTGAGDLYAAGVLFGLTSRGDLEAALRIGSLAAAEIITHLGARPRTRLGSLVTAL